jgi:hypothetical protein
MTPSVTYFQFNQRREAHARIGSAQVALEACGLILER